MFNNAEMAISVDRRIGLVELQIAGFAPAPGKDMVRISAGGHR